MKILNLPSAYLSLTICLTLIILGTFEAKAQTIDRHVFGSGGGSILSDNGMLLSYHMGEAVAFTIMGPTGRLNQGFIQSDALLSTSVPNLTSTTTYRYFPNPATRDLFIQCESCRIHQWSLYNAQGQLIMSSTGEVHGMSEIGIDVSSLTPGLYLITILDGSKDLTSRTHLKFLKI